MAKCPFCKKSGKVWYDATNKIDECHNCGKKWKEEPIKWKITEVQ